MSKLFEVKVSVFIITESESEARDYVESIIDDAVCNDKELQDYIIEKKAVMYELD